MKFLQDILTLQQERYILIFDMDEFIATLNEYADWADANEWDVPICLGDDLRKAAHCIKAYEEIICQYENYFEYLGEELNGR